VRFQGIAEQVNIIHRGFIFKSVVTFHETLFLSPLSTFVLYLGLEWKIKQSSTSK
jgi:hypothetical protein